MSTYFFADRDCSSDDERLVPLNSRERATLAAAWLRGRLGAGLARAAVLLLFGSVPNHLSPISDVESAMLQTRYLFSLVLGVARFGVGGRTPPP